MYACDCEDCKIQLSANGKKTQFQSVFNTVEKALKRLYDKGSYQPSELLNVPEYKAIIEETAKVFDEVIKDNVVPEEMSQKLKNDAFIFSGLKTHAQLMEATTMLLDDKGKVRNFEQFARDFNKINKNYNQNYLEAEWRFAISSSQSAANWAKIDKTGRYNLQYRTANDDRVRDNHKVLHDITLPQDDPFWLSYYPPNGWRCRCRAVEVLKSKYEVSDSQKAQELGEKATTQIDKNGKNKLEIFRFNPGAEQKLFPPKHPYNKVKGAGEVKKVLEKEISKIKDTSQYDNDVFKYFHRNTTDVINSEVHQNALKINNRIRPAETLCINNYTNDFYYEINQYLIAGREPRNEFYEKYIKVTNGGLDKLEAYKGNVFRGADLNWEQTQRYIDAFESKKPYTEKHFLSTSKAENRAFERNTSYAIKSKNGKIIEKLSAFEHEEEVLFRAGTKFKILNIENRDGITHIEMEEL